MVDDADVHLLRNDGVDGLSGVLNALRTGYNSGYQAMGLAIAAGAARVVLVGYDMQFKAGEGSLSHWHGGHPEPVGESFYTGTCNKFFNELPPTPGVDIVNATITSVLSTKRYRRAALQDVV